MMQLPGAIVAERIGAKFVLVSGILGTSSLTLLVPTVVTLGGAYGLMGLRVVAGIMQGTMWASVPTLLAAWVPRNERGTLASFAYSGLSVSNVVNHIHCKLLFMF